MTTTAIATLGPAGTDHERASDWYARTQRLDHRLELFDGLAPMVEFLLAAPGRLAVANSAHPDVDLLTTKAWASVGILDTFVMDTMPLALVARRDAPERGRIALMPATRGYVDVNRWDSVTMVSAKPVARQQVLCGDADAAIISLRDYEAHRNQLRLVEPIGPVECCWLVYGRRTRLAQVAS